MSTISTRIAPRATRHAPRATRHAPRATRHAPRATRHAPRATRHAPRATRHAPRERRASMVVELILVLPILLILLFGMIEIGTIMAVRFQLLAASQQGARVAAQGGSDDEVEAAATQVLGTGNVANAVQVVTNRLPDDPNNPGNGRQRVQVFVVLNAGQVVPELLSWAGIEFSGP